MAITTSSVLSLKPVEKTLANMIGHVEYDQVLTACLDEDESQAVAASLNLIAGASHLSTYECGWWTDLETGKPAERNVLELLALIHSEISEAVEAARKDQMDDHLPTRKGIEVELADALHRIFDLSTAMGLDIGGAFIEKLVYNRNRSDHKIENRNQKGGKKA